jgi:hypothetical protein
MNDRRFDFIAILVKSGYLPAQVRVIRAGRHRVRFQTAFIIHRANHVLKTLDRLIGHHGPPIITDVQPKSCAG